MQGLRTDRLQLRRWRDTDRVPFAAMNADPRVTEYLPAPLMHAESDAMVDRIEAHFDQHGFGLWAVEIPAIAPLAGFIGLSVPGFEAPFTPCVEIGWRLAPECWGSGYATEGARAVLSFGFETLGLEEIVSFTVPDNLRSRRVMEKIGMTHNLDEDFDHPRLPEGHPLRRHFLYRISRVALLALFVLFIAPLAPACVPRNVPPKTLPAPAAEASFPLFSPGTADPRRKEKLLAVAPRLDEHFRAIFADTHATGAAVGIVLDGELVYARTFGVRDVETNAAVDVDTVFRIASMTKSFTAAAALKLRDEGKVVLDAPAATYLPELASLAGPTRDAPAMTVRQLLTMASGLPFDDAWGVVTFGASDEELGRLIRSGIPLASAPGERYAYSNLGYALLGKVVERVSGVRFRDYVSAKILRPLDMQSTVWEAGDVPRSRLAVGYRRVHDTLVPEPRPSDGVFDAAGGLYTSLRDYARYVAFQLAAYPPRDDAESGPLRRATVREMHAGQRWSRWRGEDVPVAKRTADGGLWLSTSNYGFGWVNVTTCLYEGIVQHGGYEPGYISTVHLLPRHGLGVAVLATTGSVGWRSIDGTLAILRDAGLLGTPPTAAPEPALVEARDTVNRLLDSWDGALVDKTFDPQSLKYSWLANLHDDFARLSRDHGRCSPTGGVMQRNRFQGSWRLRCEKGEIEFSTSLAPGVPARIQNVESKEVTQPAGGGSPTEPGATCAE